MEIDKKEGDPFSSIIKRCLPTPSQAAKLANCPFAGESDNFADSLSGHLSSSPDPTPSPPQPILMVSPPSSVTSLPREPDDDAALFHTPPEHHNSNLSSSEDQNPNELRDVDSIENALDGLPSKKARVIVDGETEEAIEVEKMEGDKGVVAVEVICLDSSDEDEEVAVEDAMGVNRKEGDGVCAIDGVRDVSELIKDGVLESGGNHGLDGVRNVSELIKDGVLESGGEGGSEKGVQVDKGKKRVEERCLDGNCEHERKRQLPASFNGTEDIYEYGYVGVGNVQRGSKSEADDDHGTRSQLPAKGKEKDVGSENVVGKKKGLMDFLDVLKVIFGDIKERNKDGCEDDDFLETAKKRGMAFPQPRWWSPEGEDC